MMFFCLLSITSLREEPQSLHCLLCCVIDLFRCSNRACVKLTPVMLVFSSADCEESLLKLNRKDLLLEDMDEVIECGGIGHLGN